MASHDPQRAAGDAAGHRAQPERGGGTIAAICTTAALALGGWALQRTVEHDAQLAALHEGRDVAVVRAELAAVQARLERLERTADRILQRLETPR